MKTMLVKAFDVLVVVVLGFAMLGIDNFNVTPWPTTTVIWT